MSKAGVAHRPAHFTAYLHIRTREEPHDLCEQTVAVNAYKSIWTIRGMRAGCGAGNSCRQRANRWASRPFQCATSRSIAAQHANCRTGGEVDFTAIRRFSDIVVAGDFLISRRNHGIFRYPRTARVRAHRSRLSILRKRPSLCRPDRVRGRRRERLTAGRAETFADDYRRLYLARREALSAWCKRLGWSYTVNHTDRLASDALVKVHLALSADAGYAAGGRS